MEEAIRVNTQHDQCRSGRLFSLYQILCAGISLVVQRLKLCTPNEEGLGLIPDLETKIPYATCHTEKKKRILIKKSVLGYTL